MDTLSGIISLECVKHQAKIEFTMSQITTKTIRVVQAKSFFRLDSPHFVFIRQTIDKTVEFPFFLRRYQSVSVSREMTNNSLLQAKRLPFLFSNALSKSFEINDWCCCKKAEQLN